MKRSIDMITMNDTICPSCTYMNTRNRDECEVCQQLLRLICPVCTFGNDPRNSKCHMCSSTLLKFDEETSVAIVTDTNTNNHIEINISRHTFKCQRCGIENIDESTLECSCCGFISNQNLKGLPLLLLQLLFFLIFFFSRREIEYKMRLLQRMWPFLEGLPKTTETVVCK